MKPSIKGRFDEDLIIRLFTKHNQTFHNDDCEILPNSKKRISIVTCDSMVENTHFKLNWHKPEQLARKIFQSNLSDIISSGGIPEWCLIQLGIPKTLKKEYLYIFIKSFLKECKTNKCVLIGGDTFRSEILTISLTMGGSTNRYITRKAKPGDFIYVTGNFGLSLIGFKILNNEIKISKTLQNIAIKKHLEPTARVQWAKQLYPYVNSMMDVSDGLYQDLSKMAKISQYQFEIHLEKIPIHSAFKDIISKEDAFISGEEYELIFTSSKQLSQPFITNIGVVTKKKLHPSNMPLIILYHNKVYTIKKEGYKHF